ncbi:hypothetical protein EIP91_004127, partial [Steccherinum ochraceum]
MVANHRYNLRSRGAAAQDTQSAAQDNGLIESTTGLARDGGKCMPTLSRTESPVSRSLPSPMSPLTTSPGDRVPVDGAAVEGGSGKSGTVKLARSYSDVARAGIPKVEEGIAVKSEELVEGNHVGGRLDDLVSFSFNNDELDIKPLNCVTDDGGPWIPVNYSRRSRSYSPPHVARRTTPPMRKAGPGRASPTGRAPKVENTTAQRAEQVVQTSRHTPEMTKKAVEASRGVTPSKLPVEKPADVKAVEAIKPVRKRTAWVEDYISDEEEAERARKSRMNPHRNAKLYDASSSNDAGQSKRQGKMVDPDNWGTSGIPAEETNADVQRQLLNSYSNETAAERLLEADGVTREEQALALAFWKAAKATGAATSNVAGPSNSGKNLQTTPDGGRVDGASGSRPAGSEEIPQTAKSSTAVDAGSKTSSKKSVKHKHKTDKKHVPMEDLFESAMSTIAANKPKASPSTVRSTSKLDTALKPSGQLAANSVLENALREVPGPTSKNGGDPPSDPSDSSSDGSSSSSSSDESDSSDGSYRPPSGGGSGGSPDGGSSAHRNKSKKKKKSKKHRRTLKPEKPSKYSGKADVTEFHRWVRQALEFAKYYHLKPPRVASAISNYLEGKAYTCYEMRISRNAADWTLREICVELFTALGLHP